MKNGRRSEGMFLSELAYWVRASITRTGSPGHSNEVFPVALYSLETQ